MAVSRAGLRDWLLQRVSAVILALYLLFLSGYLFLHSPVDFTAWQTLFTNPWMQGFSLLTLFSLLIHAWVGIWTVFTDYIKLPRLRLVLQIAVLLALASFTIWGIDILWG